MAIGDVRAQSTVVNPVQASANANDFGAGVAQSLQSLGTSFDRFAESREGLADAQAAFGAATKNRADKSISAGIDTRLLRFNAETERELAQMRLDAPSPTVEEHAVVTENFLRERYNEFNKTIPQDLQENYATKLEGSIQSGVTKAFNFDAQARTSEYEVAVTGTMEQITNSILEGRTRQGEWGPQVQDLLINSVLTTVETEKLRLDIETQMQTAQLQRDLNVEALEPDLTQGVVPNATADGSDVVAAGLPSATRGILNGIASVEAPHYNTLNGGGTFSDYSKHPGKQGNKSTAAGRYQFIESTWNEAKAALGLEDFSPESQDRAAWWLAQRDYKARSGRNLLVDLESGDFALIAGARRYLAGSGSGENASGVTWEGLQHMGDQEFFNHVVKSGGTPNSLVFDPRFYAVGNAEKMSLFRQAEAGAASQRAAQASAEAATTGAMLSEMQFGIEAGTVGEGDIQNFSTNRNLSYEQTNKLIEAFEKKNSQVVGARNWGGVLASPNPTFDNSAASKSDANSFYREALQQGIGAEDPASSQALVESVRAIPHIPSDAVAQLSQMTYSQNPQTARYALDTLNQLRQTNESLFNNQVSNETVSDTLLYASDFLSEEQLSQELRDRHNPQLVQLRREREDEIKTLRKDEPKKFQAEQIADELDFATDNMDPTQANALQAEYAAQFSHFYQRLGNEDAAHKAAEASINMSWGDFGVGDDAYFMKHPPHKSGYEPYNGSYNYINNQVQNDFNLAPTDVYRLIPEPGVTDSAIARGELPAYGVMILNNQGLWETQLEEQNGVLTGNYAMTRFEITEEMHTKAIDDTVWRQGDVTMGNELQQLSKERQQLEAQITMRKSGLASTHAREQNALDPNSPEVIDGLQKTLDQVKAREVELQSAFEAHKENAPEDLDPLTTMTQVELKKELLALDAEFHKGQMTTDNQMSQKEYTLRYDAIIAAMGKKKGTE